ncbi:MAG: hypothetical protein HC815_37575 [Richelia sp. RM1_1_1]|nr:hypothetical protein [Richelia sp. RM1_1_1]
MDNYYSGEEPAFKVLKRYVKYGSDLLFNSKLRHEILGVTAAVIGLEEHIVENNNDDLKTAQEAVISEVENDISAFEEYLRFAIFEAAGFEPYCIQELKSLIDSFRDKEGTWTGVALNEWLQGNSLLLDKIPGDLKSKESDLEVSERLRQLSTALEK